MDTISPADGIRPNVRVPSVRHAPERQFGSLLEHNNTVVDTRDRQNSNPVRLD